LRSADECAGIGWVACLLALCVGLFAVTAASASTSSEQRVTPRFVTKVERWCTSVDTRFKQALGKFPFQDFNPVKPDAKKVVLVGRHFAKVLPIRRTIPRQLRALGEPATGRAQWDRIKALALRTNTIAINQTAAALSGNTRGFVATLKQLDQAHQALGQRATAAGFRKNSACGEIF
jgi:hypothetical protein